MTRSKIWYRQVVTAITLDLMENKLETPLEEAFVGRLVLAGDMKRGRLIRVTISGLAEWMRVPKETMRRCIRALEARGIIRCYFPGHSHPGWVELVPFGDIVRRSQWVYRQTFAQEHDPPDDVREALTPTSGSCSRGNGEILLDSLDSPPDLATDYRPDSTDDLASVHPLHERGGQRASQRGMRSGSAGLARAAQLAAHHVRPGPLGSRDPRALGDILGDAWKSS